ncbi:DUF3781 domain-containing protein [Coriobacterium glomerans]|uniref:DUF3781 domain-containing protein n=1 Tax=Coriobacterium glomerans TaxID=33871 RepID=UPI001FDF8B1F|nr:DUF3781 domain-containing protein [Coriobacterium glomerans]
MQLNVDDLVAWCQEKLESANVSISRKGKNWYIGIDGCIITVNTRSYTIITHATQTRAHTC